jgi:hypothetical protein
MRHAVVTRTTHTSGFLSPLEEHKLEVYESKMFRKIYVSKSDVVFGEFRTLHNEEI